MKMKGWITIIDMHFQILQDGFKDVGQSIIILFFYLFRKFCKLIKKFCLVLNFVKSKVVGIGLIYHKGSDKKKNND